MKNEFIEEHYCESSDMTFITKEVQINGEMVSLEVVGFYFGEPDESLTVKYLNKLKAEFKGFSMSL